MWRNGWLSRRTESVPRRDLSEGKGKILSFVAEMRNAGSTSGKIRSILEDDFGGVRLSLMEMLLEHSMIQTVFFSHNPKPLQRVSFLCYSALLFFFPYIYLSFTPASVPFFPSSSPPRSYCCCCCSCRFSLYSPRLPPPIHQILPVCPSRQTDRTLLRLAILQKLIHHFPKTRRSVSFPLFFHSSSSPLVHFFLLFLGKGFGQSFLATVLSDSPPSTFNVS